MKPPIKTVGDLIASLQQYPKETPCLIATEGGVDRLSVSLDEVTQTRDERYVDIPLAHLSTNWIEGAKRVNAVVIC